MALVAHLISAVGCGLFAGLLLAFTAYVMTALGRLPAVRGIAAMQSIDVAIINPAFLLLFPGRRCRVSSSRSRCETASAVVER